MQKTNNEILRELYIQKLFLAKGDMSINDFARRAGISAGNFCRMLKGQAAKPDTLKKIADARPDIEFLYEELMYAAGYFSLEPGKSQVKSQKHGTVQGELIALPVLKSLKGSKNKILTSNSCGIYYYPKAELENDKSFVYSITDDGLAPLIKTGDMVVFDSIKVPKDGDVVLFRIKRERCFVRYYRSMSSKIIAYGSGREQLPEYFSKNDVEIIGVAIKALLNL